MAVLNVQNPKLVVIGGDSIFGIVDTRTGVNYEYHVELKRNIYLVSVKGMEYGTKWVYAGYLSPYYQYSKGNKGSCEPTCPAIKGLLYALSFTTPLPAPMRMYHDGKCARCRKPLTDYASVKTGFGPGCRKKVGYDWKD